MIEMKNAPTIKVKKLREDAIIPTRGSTEAAGIDLYACIDEEDVFEYGNGYGVLIDPGETYTVDTGIAFDIPEGYFGAVFVRSSIGFKKNLRLANGTGVIDFDYKGNVRVCLHNFGTETQEIRHGDRIAQIVLLPYVTFPIEEVEELTETERGTGGIGSTGR